MKRSLFIATGIPLLAICLMAAAQDKPQQEKDADLVNDLKLIQGSWELQHGNEGKGRPTTRSVKTIEGNRETLRRYNASTGRKTHEHSVEIKLSKSGEVRVCTFYGIGGKPENGASFIYKVDEENFYDVTGMLQGAEYRNYQNTPTIWHWKRVTEDAAPETPEPKD